MRDNAGRSVRFENGQRISCPLSKLISHALNPGTKDFIIALMSVTTACAVSRFGAGVSDMVILSVAGE